MASLIKAVTLVGMVAFFGCGTGETEVETSEIDPCETTTADYTTVGAPFIQTWCTPCHHSELTGEDRPVGSESVNLDSFDLVIEHLDRIELRALGDSPSMPPAGGPSEDDLKRLTLWIECGALESMAVSESR